MTTHRCCAHVVAWPLVCLFAAAQAPAPRAEVPVPMLNPGFDSTVTVAGKLVPAVWRMTVGDTTSYDFACDTDGPQSGAGALRVRVKVDGTTSCCHIDQRLADTLVGHRLRVQAWLKASSDIFNNAQFVIQVGDTRQGGWRQVQWLNVSGFRSTEWTHIDGQVALSSDANRVVVTIYTKPNQPAGTTVWVDAIEVTDLSTGVVHRIAGAARNSERGEPLTVYAVDGRRVLAQALPWQAGLAPGVRVSPRSAAVEVR